MIRVISSRPIVHGLSIGRDPGKHESVTGLIRWLCEVNPDELQIATEIRSGIRPRTIPRPVDGWASITEQALGPHLEAVLGRGAGTGQFS